MTNLRNSFPEKTENELKVIYKRFYLHFCDIFVETLKTFLDFNYAFDSLKPSGFPKRVMDISRAREMIHYNPTTSLADGLQETWKWFINNTDEYLRKQNYFKES